MQPSTEDWWEPCPVCGGKMLSKTWDPQEAIFLECTECDHTDAV